jgi:hypothetical protein
LEEALGEAGMVVAEQVGREAELRAHRAPKVSVIVIEKAVTDKGYHSGARVKRIEGVWRVQSNTLERKSKGRKWAGKA